MSEINLTGDGSSTLYVPDPDEHYHSMFGAVTESKHVIIQNGGAMQLKENGSQKKSLARDNKSQNLIPTPTQLIPFTRHSLGEGGCPSSLSLLSPKNICLKQKIFYLCNPILLKDIKIIIR